MIILDKKISLSILPTIEDETFFDDDEMVKAVVDIKRRILALNAELHSDLESYLLDNGSEQTSLYGINIYYDKEIEYDSLINPPRNREAGFPRVGRYVADPNVRQIIEEVVNEWITN